MTENSPFWVVHICDDNDNCDDVFKYTYFDMEDMIKDVIDDILDNTQNQKELVSILKMSPMLVYYLICIETKNINILYEIYWNKT